MFSFPRLTRMRRAPAGHRRWLTALQIKLQRKTSQVTKQGLVSSTACQVTTSLGCGAWQLFRLFANLEYYRKRAEKGSLQNSGCLCRVDVTYRHEAVFEDADSVGLQNFEPLLSFCCSGKQHRRIWQPLAGLHLNELHQTAFEIKLTKPKACTT